MPSIVWDYFDEFEGGGKCRLCGCIRNRKDKSTSTFWQHLERVHGLDKRQMMMGGANLGSLPKVPRNKTIGNNVGNVEENEGGGGGGLFMGNGLIRGGNGRMHQSEDTEAEKMPKLDLVDGLGLDQKATEETFRFISELVKQQQQQQQQQLNHSTSMPAMPSLEPVDEVKREFSPFERVVTPIGINKRSDLVMNTSRAGEGIFGGECAIGIGGGETSQKGAGRKRKMLELPPTPPPSQLYNSTTPTTVSSTSASASSSSLLNNYLSGILDFANSPLNFASLANSVIASPSFASPIPPQLAMVSQGNSNQKTVQNDQQILGIASKSQQQQTSQSLSVPTNTASNQPKSPSKKKTDYLSWDEFFMGTALLTAQRSKDPITQVGACIVRENIIVGVGYNGMPIGCNDDLMPWSKEESDPLENKYLYVCHAEMNAIMNKNCADIKGATLYTTLFPCSECAKLIIQSHIKRVVYLRDKEAVQMEASRRLFNMTGIKYSQFEPTRSEIVLRFK